MTIMGRWNWYLPDFAARLLVVRRPATESASP
jgi:hypothetical protein